MKGQGAMIENWFLEGHAANAYCEVANDGTLMCNLSEEGNYVIKEVRITSLHIHTHTHTPKIK
jgi:hypothetical protein